MDATIMNLYFFSETRRGSVYGVGTYIYELTNALKGNNITIYLVQLTSEKQQIQTEEIDGIHYLYFPAPIADLLSMEEQKQWELYHRNIVYLLQLHIKDKRNLVFHLNYTQKGNLANELKNAFDCRIVITVHYLSWHFSLPGSVTHLRQLLAIEDNAEKGDINKIIIQSFQTEKELFQAADQIICLSEGTRKILNHDYQINLDKTAVIYNGLTDKPQIADKQILRQQYHIPDIPVVLFVGRIVDKKGLTFLINSFKKVVSQYPDCHLILAGDGDFKTYMKECEEIFMNVSWVGMYSKERLYDLYGLADIGILPSLSEQCSYVVIEMMMNGLPMITTSAPGLSEMTEDGVSSLQVPLIEFPEKIEMDTDLLAEKMLYLFNHPNEAKRLGENARKCYEKYYSMDVFRDNMLNFYHSLY